MDDMEGSVTLPRYAYDELLLAKATLDDITLVAQSQAALHEKVEASPPVPAGIGEHHVPGIPGTPGLVLCQPFAVDSGFPTRYSLRFDDSHRAFMWFDIERTGDVTVYIDSTNGSTPCAPVRLNPAVLPATCKREVKG